MDDSPESPPLYVGYYSEMQLQKPHADQFLINQFKCILLDAQPDGQIILFTFPHQFSYNSLFL